jgi:hypothetical protein
MPKGRGYTTEKGIMSKTGKKRITHVNSVPTTGGGGMHQMGPARPTKNKTIKQKVVNYLSTPNAASKAVNKVAKKVARKSLGIKMKKGRE